MPCGARDQALRALRRLLQRRSQCARPADLCICGRSRSALARSRSAKSACRAAASPKSPPSRSASAPRRRSSPTARSSKAFMKTAFGAEYHLAGRVDRIRKYDAPVRVFADGNRADRKAQLAKIVADIAARVQHLDIAMAESQRRRQRAGQAGARPRSLSHHRDLLRQRTGASEIRSSLDPQCLSGFPQERAVRNRAFRRHPRPSTTATSSSSTAPMRNCCSRWDRSTIPRACPGPCSTTMCRWAISTSTTSIILNLLYDPADQGRHDRAGGQGGAARTCWPTSAPGCSKVNNLPDVIASASRQSRHDSSREPCNSGRAFARPAGLAMAAESSGNSRWRQSGQPHSSRPLERPARRFEGCHARCNPPLIPNDNAKFY